MKGLRPYLAGAQWAWSLATERPYVPLWWVAAVALPLFVPAVYQTALAVLLFDAGFAIVVARTRAHARTGGFDDLLLGNGMSTRQVSRVWMLAVLGVLGATGVVAAALSLASQVEPARWVWHVSLRSLWAAGLAALLLARGRWARSVPALALLPAALTQLRLVSDIRLWPWLTQAFVAWSPAFPVETRPGTLALVIPALAIAHLWARGGRE